MKRKCVDCGINEALPEDELCAECREEIEPNVIYKIPWVKYDPDNPPETGKNYLVTDGRSVDVAWFERYFDDEPSTWYPPDRSNLDKETCHYYAPINLPGEETTDDIQTNQS